MPHRLGRIDKGLSPSGFHKSYNILDGVYCSHLIVCSHYTDKVDAALTDFSQSAHIQSSLIVDWNQPNTYFAALLVKCDSILDCPVFNSRQRHSKLLSST